jgi:sulfite exporter TauE/SafE
MDAALTASALFMGLTGSLHCTTMCGPAFGAIAARSGGTRFAGATMSLHAGRLLGYAIAGALVASSVAALGTLQAAGPLLRPLWTLVHVAAIALGLTLVWTARVPRWLSRDIGRAAIPDDARVVRFFRRMPASGRAGLTGMCWAGIPCGLLQSALLVAALASGPVAGATVMSTFALASGFGLWAGPRLWSTMRSTSGDERWTRLSARLSGTLLAASSGFALWHGLGAIVAQICGVPPSPP